MKKQPLADAKQQTFQPKIHPWDAPVAVEPIAPRFKPTRSNKATGKQAVLVVAVEAAENAIFVVVFSIPFTH